MRTSNIITIKAPLHVIYNTAADLAHWPDFLSHYRYNKFLSKMPWGGIVKMSAVRTFIPTTWISEYRIDSTPSTSSRPSTRRAEWRSSGTSTRRRKGSALKLHTIWNCTGR